MADPKRNTPPAGEPTRGQMMRVLVPAAAVAVVIVLVAVIASVSGGGRKMSDGSDGSADDPGLRPVTAGVRVRDLKEGDGEPCPPGASVKVHYTGWLTDGTVFDSSKEGGRGPAPFSLNEVVKGWGEGIPGMKPGGVRKLVIDPDKGYANQAKGKIPPGSTLIFEVELLEVVPPPKPPSGPGRPMPFDSSDGGTEDPGLKPIGSRGLRYRDLKEGTGEPVKPGASVTVHYTGWLASGSEFDSSRNPGRTAFDADLAPGAPRGVIAGWQQGVPGMKPGGVRKLVIPPELGYGNQDKKGIPPNSTLIFEVELVK